MRDDCDIKKKPFLNIVFTWTRIAERVPTCLPFVYVRETKHGAKRVPTPARTRLCSLEPSNETHFANRAATHFVARFGRDTRGPSSHADERQTREAYDQASVKRHMEAKVHIRRYICIPLYRLLPKDYSSEQAVLMSSRYEIHIRAKAFSSNIPVRKRVSGKSFPRQTPAFLEGAFAETFSI